MRYQISLWSTSVTPYGHDGSMLGLSPRCWCGYHTAGFMTKLDVIAHNKYVRERIEFYNEKWGTKHATALEL